MIPAIAARLAPWLPPLLLMGLIFGLSAQPDLGTGLGTIDLILRKIAHMSEYALLTFLWWRVLRTLVPSGAAPFAAFAVAIAYACTDEFHQTFVTGRHGTPVDVCIDAIGGAVAVLLIRARAREHA